MSVRRITDFYWKEIPTKRPDYPVKYEVRFAIAVLGVGRYGNPFDERFDGDYIRGVGMTRDAALRDAERNYNDMVKCLWA